MAPRKGNKAKGKRKAPPAASSSAKASSSKKKKVDTAAAAAAPTRKLPDREKRGKNTIFSSSSPAHNDDGHPPPDSPPPEGYLQQGDGTQPASDRRKRRPTPGVGKPFNPTSPRMRELRDGWYSWSTHCATVIQLHCPAV